jgi:hypothetical protein
VLSIFAFGLARIEGFVRAFPIDNLLAVAALMTTRFANCRSRRRRLLLLRTQSIHKRKKAKPAPKGKYLFSPPRFFFK